jgi:hypothetical protein
VSYFATDNAGNVEATKTLAIKLDKTPPTITASRSPAPNPAGWNNTSVNVSFACSDALSGVFTCSGSATVSAEGANQGVQGNSTDIAGNSASLLVSGINIDRTPPVTTAQLAGTAGGGGWFTGPVTVDTGGHRQPVWSGVDQLQL